MFDDLVKRTAASSVSGYKSRMAYTGHIMPRSCTGVRLVSKGENYDNSGNGAKSINEKAGLEFRVQSLEFRVQSLEFRVQSLEFRVIWLLSSGATY
jgi:hypothetical protein